MLSLYEQYQIEQTLLQSPYNEFISEGVEKRIWYDEFCERSWIETFGFADDETRCINCCLIFKNGVMSVLVLDAFGSELAILPIVKDPVSLLLGKFEQKALESSGGKKYYDTKAGTVREVIAVLSGQTDKEVCV